MAVKAICLVGMPGCGKEEFLKVVREEGLPIVRMGDIVREEARKRGLSMTDTNLGGLAHEERLKHGYGIWATRTLPHIHEDITVIDGIRSDQEVEIFRKKWGDSLIVVAIHASPLTRFNRLSLRGRSDDAKDIKAFRRRDQRELGWGIGKVIAMADYMIVNEGDLEQFREKARQILNEIRAGGSNASTVSSH